MSSIKHQILGVLLKLGADVKNSTLLQDCGESDINYSIDLVMIERTEST